MIIELNPTACYGKATSGSEYGMIRTGVDLPPPEISAAAAAWMAAFLSVSQRTMASLHRADGRWWLIRAEDEPTTDGAGRRRAFLVLGGLPSEPAPQAVPSLLVALAKMPVSKATPPTAIDPGSKADPAPSTESASAALALALGDAQVSVGSPEAIASVLNAVGVGNCRWIALFPRNAPARLPDGNGLVFTGETLPVPTEVRQFMKSAGQESVLSLPLSGLPTASPDRAVRLDLVRLALGVGERVGSALSAQAASWLATTPAGRDVALAHLDDSAIGDWLAGSDGRAEDLVFLRDKGRLKPGHRAPSLLLVKGLPDPVDAYARAFPDDPEGMVLVMPEPIRSTWRWLAEGINSKAPDAAAVDRLLETIAPTPLAARLDPSRLARASATGSRVGALEFASSLASQGLPGLLANALAGSAAAPRSAPTLPPPLGMAAEWLVGIGVVADRWLTLEGSLAKSPEWGPWWRAGLEALHGGGSIAPEQLLTIGIRHGWLSLLKRVGAPPGLITLLDPAGGRVRMPASRWPAAAGELLIRLHREDTLLDRIDGELGDELVDWLGQWGDDDMTGFFRRLLGSFRRGDPVPPKSLAKAALLLSRADVLRQVATYAVRPTGPERSAAIETLLGSDWLSREERDWLDARTLRCSPIPLAPEWSVEDLLALFPMLNLVDDVVRVILARPVGSDRDRERDLLEMVVDALRARSVPPPGDFPASAQKTRPDWVRALAALPGWEDCAGSGEKLRLFVEYGRDLAGSGDGQLPPEIRRAIQDFIARVSPGKEAR